MRLRNKKIISAVAALLLVCMPFSRVTAETFSTSASGSTSISKGEEFTITFSFSSSSNIYGIDAALNYDSSKLSITSSSGAGAFSATVGGRIAAWTVNGTTSGSFASVTFKAISGFGQGESTTISLGDVSGSDGDNDVSGSGCSITVSIPSGQSSGNNGGSGSNGGSNNSSKTNNDPSLSTDSSLKGLSISGYALSPSFSSNAFEYSVSVDFETEKLDITATPNDSKATVRCEGNELKAGATSKIFVIVTAENGSTSTYTIIAQRDKDPNAKASSNCDVEALIPSSGKLLPVFDKDTFNYIIETDGSVREMTFEVQAFDANASCNVIGEPQLISGRENMYHIVCTAEDGTSTKIYNVTVRCAQNYETYVSQSYVNSITKKIKDGQKNVFLDMSFCPVQLVDADIFKTLKDSEGVTVTLKTKNGTISFCSDEMDYEITQDVYDLTMIRSSTYSDDFLSAMGSYENYVFSTHYKAELPGFATFTVYTNLSKGQVVNVYSYDESEDKMIIAAKNIVVSDGGGVSFDIDKGGDFVITTMDVENAEAYHSVNRVSNTPTIARFLVYITIGIAVLCAGFCIGYFAGKSKGCKNGHNKKHKKNKRNAEKKSEMNNFAEGSTIISSAASEGDSNIEKEKESIFSKKNKNRNKDDDLLADDGDISELEAMLDNLQKDKQNKQKN